MALRSVPVSPGTFCWFELASRDVKSGRAFYEALMRAQSRAIGGPEDSPAYLILDVDGSPVAGLSRESDEAGPCACGWLPHVAVDDVDDCCRRASALGGRIRAEPSDSSFGRSALVEDPTGGVIALFHARPGATDGTNPVGPGAFVWCELVTRDVPLASEFYAKLLGWTPQFCTAGATCFIEMKVGSQAVASVFEACADDERSPAHWCPYLCVVDIDASLAAAVRHGGRKLCEPMDIPGVGRYAGLTDPTGAHVALIESTET